MSTRIVLRHRIEERFSRPVRLSTQWLRLRPAPGARATVSAYSLKVEAEPHFLNWVRDPFENHLARLDLPEPVTRLALDVEVVAELEPLNPFDFLLEPYAADFPIDYPAQLRKELAPYLALPAAGPRLAAFLKGLDEEPAYIVEFLGRVNGQIHAAVASTLPSVAGPIDLEVVLAQGAGTPWAIAWLGTLGLRALGLAARFVSGYRVFLAEEPVASFHAWTEVYLPGAGWVGLDPAGGLFAHEGYLPLAAAPDPLRALPLVGYREACEERVREEVMVRRLRTEPPVWPFGAAQWADVQAVGRRIDADLTAAGVELAVQPALSFVSADAPNQPEWTSTAQGPDKRRVAETLLLRLRDRLAPGGVVQLGQGEWFAGEPLPRWRLSCWWRADGVPVCREPGRIGWGRAPEDLTLEEAARFGHTLARALGLSPAAVVPAYEDGLYELWGNHAQLDFAPDPSELSDPERRRALADRLSLSRGEPRGYVLPLRWDGAVGRWVSGAWRFRRGAVFLLPGDSPMGYRLPLEGLSLEEQAAADPERCQFEARPALPELHGEVSARLSRVAPAGAAALEADAEDAPRTPRTAVCMEIRGGRLHVFLPPLTHLEHTLELMAAIEAAAEGIGADVYLEGYEPPEDCRLRRIVLEPDAGVLRMHLPEALDSTELEALVRAAYEEAGRVGLRGERVLEDGRHLPCAGGAPLVLGGREPAQSPFLRRPELLRSLIAYWHRHPSLSYLFAGRDIGPSGAAPRPDEGRDEALYELAIALERLGPGEAAMPWLADRVLRHLLTDPAGDMRRAQIRIDALYDPARAARRLGRVSLAGFETAPVAELATAQALLVRGLLARFLRYPERGPLTRWGAQLHDRFMLPRLLWEDFRAVLDDLAGAGYPFQPEWFEPLIARRFPVLGAVRIEDIELELRAAHEPWTVLAEEVTASGVGRFLDSANDRVQVRLTGLTPGRYVLECNAERVPLRGTGVVGEAVAGVRYKAWNPPATLHPTVPAVDALVFDLIDTWSGRVVGGCTYHPARPGRWGALGTPVPAAIGPQGGPGAQALRHAPPALGLPVWESSGRFMARGSGRSTARPAPERPDPERPYLLDLSFPR